MDARVLEKEKENIQPFVFGRSASKLGRALSEGRNPSVLMKQREKFESDLLSEELDDPLQIYVEYISWTHAHYPQGANSESGLLRLLERCTSCFRDTSHYKNDPRYLKIWLEYAAYSDAPRDIFVYLAKKNIGQELALYYEQFAAFLESKGSISDAREVYEIGLERNAWPPKRLQRSLNHFVARTGSSESSNPLHPSEIRASIAAPPPSAAAVWSDSVQPSKRQKLVIHHDESPATLKETVFTPNDSARLNSTVLTSKENRIAPNPWAGQMLKQKEAGSESEKKPAKFEVFRDDDSSALEQDFDLRQENNQIFTIVQQPGKPREKISVNMKLLYPSADTEFCLGELLAMSSMQKKTEPQRPPKTGPKSIDAAFQKGSSRDKMYTETEQTFTIPLRHDDEEDNIQKPRSPTITMMSRMATNEVIGMFNDAAINLHSDDDTGKDFEDSTNYDGFHTETIHVQSQDTQDGPTTRAATPPTDYYDTDGGSSPFLERP
ncbi:hypothetical protein JCM33374_g1801 [Metschnikowia sp. JCM 33374]|nr:hypothetical protein JCM33374_g1801 [Metschnikowia sp. JCM 33374]